MTLNSDSQNAEAILAANSDQDAARRAIAGNWPTLDPASAEYARLCDGLAKFHSCFGAESFELRYNLRPPKVRVEVWLKQEMLGQITEEELRSKLKADAERPIDLEMLAAFHDAIQGRLEHYSGVLQKSVIRPSEAGSSVVEINKNAIDDHISAMASPMSLWKENLRTVLEFLQEFRITAGHGLAKIGSLEATSVHWLAELYFKRMADAWQSCREISERSHHYQRYMYAADAIELFHGSWFSQFPSPQSLSEHLREEFILARAEIRRTSANQVEETSVDSQSPVDGSAVRWSIDNESRELILIGEIFSLVGSAGHIFRPTLNSDWGIDGEIEFKDHLGLASGKRVYVQLKSGDSHLKHRKSDGVEVFTVKNLRHLQYWKQQPCPVMLVVRQSSGLIRWMDVSASLQLPESESPQIIFRGEPVTPATVRMLADRYLTQM